MFRLVYSTRPLLSKAHHLVVETRPDDVTLKLPSFKTHIRYDHRDHEVFTQPIARSQALILLPRNIVNDILVGVRAARGGLVVSTVQAVGGRRASEGVIDLRTKGIEVVTGWRSLFSRRSVRDGLSRVFADEEDLQNSVLTALLDENEDVGLALGPPERYERSLSFAHAIRSSDLSQMAGLVTKAFGTTGHRGRGILVAHESSRELRCDPPHDERVRSVFDILLEIYRPSGFTSRD